MPKKELRLKRAELAERIKELSSLQAELEGQILSIEVIITIYDPDYVAQPNAPHTNNTDDMLFLAICSQDCRRTAL